MKRSIQNVCAAVAATAALLAGGVSAAAPASAAASYRTVHVYIHQMCVLSSANYSVVWVHRGVRDFAVRPGRCVRTWESSSTLSDTWYRIQGNARTAPFVTHPYTKANFIARTYGGTFQHPIITVRNS